MSIQMEICDGDLQLLVRHKDGVADVLRKLGLTDVVASYRGDKQHWETVATVTISADEKRRFRRVITELRDFENLGVTDLFIEQLLVNSAWNGTSPWDSASWKISA